MLRRSKMARSEAYNQNGDQEKVYRTHASHPREFMLTFLRCGLFDCSYHQQRPGRVMAGAIELNGEDYRPSERPSETETDPSLKVICRSSPPHWTLKPAPSNSRFRELEKPQIPQTRFPYYRFCRPFQAGSGLHCLPQ